MRIWVCLFFKRLAILTIVMNLLIQRLLFFLKKKIFTWLPWNHSPLSLQPSSFSISSIRYRWTQLWPAPWWRWWCPMLLPKYERSTLAYLEICKSNNNNKSLYYTRLVTRLTYSQPYRPEDNREQITYWVFSDRVV